MKAAQPKPRNADHYHWWYWYRFFWRMLHLPLFWALLGPIKGWKTGDQKVALQALWIGFVAYCLSAGRHYFRALDAYQPLNPAALRRAEVLLLAGFFPPLLILSRVGRWMIEAGGPLYAFAITVALIQISILGFLTFTVPDPPDADLGPNPSPDGALQADAEEGDEPIEALEID